MDFILYVFEHAVTFFVASVPLILVFVQLKIFKLPPKVTAICLLLNLLVSVFFWIKLKELNLAIYQGIPYASSFLWLWGENVLRKKMESSNSEDDVDS